MKGTSSVADTTCRIANRQQSRANWNSCGISGGSRHSSGGGYDLLACCMTCQDLSSTTAVTIKKDGTGCWCDNMNQCSGSYSSGSYDIADCSCVSKRRRRSTSNETVIDTFLDLEEETNSEAENDDEDLMPPAESLISNHSQRYVRQAVDTTKQREIRCEWGWNSDVGVAGGYWSYEHEVPEYCFSKYESFQTYYSLKFYRNQLYSK